MLSDIVLTIVILSVSFLKLLFINIHIILQVVCGTCIHKLIHWDSICTFERGILLVVVVAELVDLGWVHIGMHILLIDYEGLIAVFCLLEVKHSLLLHHLLPLVKLGHILDHLLLFVSDIHCRT